MQFYPQRSFKIFNSRSVGLLLALGIAVSSARAQTLDSLNPAPQNTVTTVAVQPDGQILLGGSFTALGGLVFSNLVRLKLDGSLDTNFNPRIRGSVSALALQTNGGIVVAGGFTSIAGQSRSYLGRLNPDGSLDASFNPGVSNTVNCLALQDDGKILIGGSFLGAGGQVRKYIARINNDGTLDSSFNPGAGSSVYCLALQPDGNIVVGGLFTTLSGQPINRIARLTVDGYLDTSFASDANAEPYCLVVQPDGKILVGGRFTTLSWSGCNRIGRLNSNGSLDTAFDPGADNSVYCVVPQADGRILATGMFTNLEGTTFNRFGRLNADTTPDSLFSAPLNAGGSATGYALALQSDGKIILGGSFTNVAGQTRTNLARFTNTDPAVQTLSFTGTDVTWVRSGTGPEFWRTTFDACTNGTDWIGLGAGTPIAGGGGWEMTGLDLPANASIRARGFSTCGRYNGSSTFVESFVGPPVITAQPAARTNYAGTLASFSVTAVGPQPITYQWRKGVTNLTDSTAIAGSRLATLTLSNVFGGDRGTYSVVVSNASGTVTSLLAVLTVLDPYIVSQPSPKWVNAGDSVAFSVSAAGTTPLRYQWRKDGTNLPGATLSSLSLTNVQQGDGGLYDVVASNVWGCVTSAPAVLGVNLAATDTFQPNLSDPVYALALQTDGRILFGTGVGGFYQTHSCFGCLQPDGSTDTNINLNVSGIQFQTWVRSLALQTNGGVLIGGSFVFIGSQSRNSLGRMTPAGVADSGFNAGISGYYPFVSCLGLQPDQKIVLAGCGEMVGFQARTNLGRVDGSGALDTSFKASTEQAVYPSQGRIYSMALQTNGQILLGGLFTNLCGVLRSHIGRLNADGSLDAGFNPGANASVECLAVQADGRILLGGAFTNIAGQARNYLARLSSDGSLDNAFNPGADGMVESFALQSDGKILVAGYFSNLAGQPCNRLGRLNADGSADTTFNPGADGTVYALALQADGKVLAGGAFQILGGQSRPNLGRLSNPDTATQLLSRNGSTLTWLRGGSCPEVWRTTFEASTNGADWNPLGAGTRIGGGWQLTSISAPTNATIRARGFVTGGQGNGSTWFVESQLYSLNTNLPFILTGDGGFGFRNNRFGFNISALPSQVVVVEASTNLTKWISLITNTSPLYFSDPDLLGYGRRFYRVRIP